LRILEASLAPRTAWSIEPDFSSSLARAMSWRSAASSMISRSACSRCPMWRASARTRKVCSQSCEPREEVKWERAMDWRDFIGGRSLI